MADDNQCAAAPGEIDASWMIALWMAIHGGDPSPEPIEVGETTMLLAAALSRHLSATFTPQAQPITAAGLQSRLKELGIAVDSGSGPTAETNVVESPIRRTRCFEWDGIVWCVNYPSGPIYIF